MMATDEQCQDACMKIIESLKDFSVIERYKILSTTLESYEETCAKAGIHFVEIHKRGK